jgi:hypothetical protein
MRSAMEFLSRVLIRVFKANRLQTALEMRVQKEGISEK